MLYIYILEDFPQKAAAAAAASEYIIAHTRRGSYGSARKILVSLSLPAARESFVPLRVYSELSSAPA